MGSAELFFDEQNSKYFGELKNSVSVKHYNIFTKNNRHRY